ncbi:MAG: MFS transporter [Chloroflexi bacterium]|nr:MFS transporter [Chloroflexota bacterium]
MNAQELSPRARALVLAGTMLGLLVAAIDQTVVSTALPRIIGELGGLSLFSWVFTAYMLTSTITVPLVGKFGDMYGRKPFFMGGILVFTIASALAGLSQNMTQLIIFRGLQGFGAGAIMSNAFAIIGDLYPPSERGKYQGLFAAVFGLASIAGPTVGGTITDNLTWRWVFYVNIPIGVVAQAVLWYGFPWVRGARHRHHIDYLGAALLTGAVVPLLLALVWGGDLYAWRSPQIGALFGASAASLAAFVFVEQRATEPIIPLKLFSNRIFQVVTVVTFLTGIGMFGAISFMPLFIQGVLGSSATNSGTVMVPMMLGMVVSSAIVGQLVSRFGHYRPFIVAGGAILALGMFLLTRMTAESSYATAVRNMIVLGIGIGIGMPILGLIVQNAVPYRLLGVVSSSTQFFRQIGGTLGVAIFGTLVTTHLRDNLQSNLPADVTTNVPPAMLGSLGDPQVLLSPSALDRLQASFASLGDAGPRLFQETVTAMRVTLADGLVLVFGVAFVVALVSLVLSVFIPELALRTTIDDLPDERAPALAPAAAAGPFDSPPAAAPARAPAAAGPFDSLPAAATVPALLAADDMPAPFRPSARGTLK